MNIHEYQAKKLLNDNGILIPKGQIAYTPLEAQTVAKKISRKGAWILKAQIHAGARSKGHFVEKKAGSGSGIRLAENLAEVYKNAEQMLGATLVTPQAKKGNYVSRIYVEEFLKIKQSFYLGMGIDRTSASIVLLAANTSNEDIGKIVFEAPEKIFRSPVGRRGPTKTQSLKVANFLDLDSKTQENFHKFVMGMFKTFINNDAIMVEINPAGVMPKGEIVALDAKIILDDKALFRHPENLPLRDNDNLLPAVIKASRYGFSYTEYGGNIGCIVNGEGLAWAMKGLNAKGFDIGCSLNVKGGVDRDKIAAGIKIIASNPRIDGIIINIFGGFLRCDLIADGIIDAAAEVGLNIPMVVRFEGTNRSKAVEILKNSALPLTMAESTNEAMEKIVKAIKESM